MWRELLDRLARRALTSIGGGAIVSGDNAAVTVGTLLIVGEFVFETIRTRRKARQNGIPKA